MTQKNQRAYQTISSQNQIDLPTNKQYFETVSSKLLSGFIHHPSTFPLSYKRLWFSTEQREPKAQQAIGLCFKSEKYLKPGIKIKISIPIRNQMQYLRGRVVLVRKMDSYFEIGVWLTQTADVHRARAIEQICHIETYLQAKRHQDGPFVSNERIAKEWIDKYAATFPATGSEQNH